VAPIAPEVARDAHVAEITLSRGADIKVSSEFEQIFRQHVRAKLDRCATGRRPLRLDARIDRFDKADPVMTAIIGGANVLRGWAVLVDAETGAPAGEYRIGQTVIGGRLAIVLMAEAEEQLSDAFGDELCRQAFATPTP
jgi:hypothetical protein